MENKYDASVKLLLDSVEAYSKTNLDILKLKYVEKKADITSTLITKSIFAIMLSLLTLNLNIALAIWIGIYLGKSFYGFLILSLFYGILSIIFLFVRKQIKTRLNDSIIFSGMNEK